ncbi:MAG: M23 family metallopeptidase [Frankia sp.]
MATAVISTIGIAMVQTAGIAHSETPSSYTHTNLSEVTTSSVAGAPTTTTGATGATTEPATDSLSDPSLSRAALLTPEQKAAQRMATAQTDRASALAELMITMQQRRVSTVAAEAARAEAPRWVRPDIGRLTQGFGGANGHPGIDLGGPYGSNILAAHSGTVIYAGWESGYGNFIQIEHDNNIVTCYGHLSRILVSVGQRVDTGQTIGYEGSTGESTGPHLHFEVRIGGQNGTKIDPLGWLSAHGVTI